MKCLVLCAGQGSRLRPLTDDLPKCMVALLGTPLIDYQLATLAACGITDVGLVTGYAAGKLEGKGRWRFHNPHFDHTNMVASLFCAREIFTGADDIIIAYSDIVYEPRVLQALIDAPGGIVTVVDRSWHDLWSVRMENPLSDAETLRFNSNGTICEIGKVAQSRTDIEGQYIGLTKFSKAMQLSVLRHYDSLSRQASYDGKSFDQMFMTSFLTSLIETGMALHGAQIDSGWLEVDTLEDLARYERMYRLGTLSRLWAPIAMTS